jgi:hypothetical protein
VELAVLLRAMPGVSVAPAHAVPTTSVSLGPDGSETIFIHSEAPARADDRYLTIVLHLRDGDRPVVVGGAILELDPQRAPSIHPELLVAIAGALHDSATTANTTQS